MYTNHGQNYRKKATSSTDSLGQLHNIPTHLLPQEFIDQRWRVNSQEQQNPSSPSSPVCYANQPNAYGQVPEYDEQQHSVSSESRSNSNSSNSGYEPINNSLPHRKDLQSKYSMSNVPNVPYPIHEGRIDNFYGGRTQVLPPHIQSQVQREQGFVPQLSPVTQQQSPVSPLAYNSPQRNFNVPQQEDPYKKHNQLRSHSQPQLQGQMNTIPNGNPQFPPQFNNNSQQEMGSFHPMSAQQMQQQRRLNRKVPPGQLPPIQTNQSVPEGRRVVSSPSYSPYGVPNNTQVNQKSQVYANDARTKSLSSTSIKYNQQKPSESNYNKSSSISGSSSHTFSLSSKSRSFSSLGKLSSLSTKKFNSSSSLQNGKLDRNPSNATINSQKTLVPSLPKKPIVYPALLSQVAKVFKESMILTINTKDGLEYHDTFTGKMAIDIICKIIRTNDRNLALLLGRSMDAQKLFRDVTYNHRLRDSVHEVYAFNNVYIDTDFYDESSNSANNSKHGSFVGTTQMLQQQLPPHSNNSIQPSLSSQGISGSSNSLNNLGAKEPTSPTGVNGIFTILTDCYSPTCSRNRLCYSIACPRRLEQQARLNLKPQGGLKRAISKLSLHEGKENKKLWHETVSPEVLENLDKSEKERQELIYELIYTERDYVKDLEFMTDFYIMPLRNPANSIIPEHEREAFIRTLFGGVSELLRLAKSLSEALTKRQQIQKPVIESIGDVLLDYVGSFEPFIKYSGNKVFANFEHERQQLVNFKYVRFLDTIERKPESRRQDLSSFLIKGIQRPARYQLFLNGIIKNTKPENPDYNNLIKAKEEIEKVLNRINIQTGESIDRHKVMVLHRLLGRQTLEAKYHFKLLFNNRIIYQITLSRKRDNEKIDLYLFEHAILLVKHKLQNKREQHKVFEKPMYLPLLFVSGGFEVPTTRSILAYRKDGSLVSDASSKNRMDANYAANSSGKIQINFLGLGKNQVHASLYADDITNLNQALQQIQSQQKKMIEKYDIFSMSKFETRRFNGNNRINCAVPCYGGKKLLSGNDSGVWVSTVRTITANSSEKVCSDPTLIISKLYVTQIEVLVEYSVFYVLSDKTLYEFDLSCTDTLDHVKNTRSGRSILSHVAFFKIGICDGKLLICAARTGNTHSIGIFEPSKNKNKRYDIREITFSSDPVSISFLKTKLCIGCTKGFEILSLEQGRKEPILDEADPSLDFATQRESVTPLGIHKLGKNFLLSYSEFSFLINTNGWRTNHEWGIFWEGVPQNIALFYPYLLSFEPGFIEIRDLNTTNLIRALVGENIRFLHSNEHEAMYACEENGCDIIVSIDFLNLKPKVVQT